MQVALMIPCYIDIFSPRVSIATLELLERLGLDVAYPKEQTCCGQPMAKSGCYQQARAIEDHCAKVFGSFENVVTPSGSCTHHIRNKFTAGTDSPERQSFTKTPMTSSNSCMTYSRLEIYPGRRLNTKSPFTQVVRPFVASTWRTGS
jgi:heterodisulfide reductase subunit B